MDKQSGDLQSEPSASEIKGLSEVDLSNSGPGEDEGTNRQEQQHQQTGSTHQLEFFEGGGGERHSGAESSEGSPEQMTTDKDSDSTHAAFVTLSPPISPGVGNRPRDNVSPSLLESLEDSTSSSDIPKSKLDKDLHRQNFALLRGGSGSIVEDEVGQAIDLKVSIMEREKQGIKSEAYFSYKICTDTTRPSHLFDKSHYEVWRRYRDFEWLREMMEKHHLTLITPPLPGKQVTRYFDQHSEEFLNERQRALDIFLKRLTIHPYFSFDDNLKVFLTAEPMAFANHVMKTSGANRLLSSVTTSVKHAATSFRLKTPDPYFAEENKYFSSLGEKLGVVERVAIRLHQEREELVKTMQDFTIAIDRWSHLEQRQLSHFVRKLGSCMENCATAVTDLNTANSFSLLMASREYQLFSASGVSVIRRRDGLQLETERASEDKDRKKKIHDDAVSAGKLQKLPKFADDLQRASVIAERTADELSRANEELRVDIDKWKEAKDREMSRLIRRVADDHISFHQKCFDEWEVVLRLLRNADEAQSSENGDSPEHRKRNISQSGSIEPSSSLISDDLFLAKVTEEEDEGETVEGGVATKGTDVIDGSSSGSGGQPKLPGLFDNDDPESNELFGGAS